MPSAANRADPCARNRRASARRCPTGSGPSESPGGRYRSRQNPQCGPHHTKIDRFWRDLEEVHFQKGVTNQPYFRSFSNRLSHALAWTATFFGAVPPKLVRLFTEDSTDKTASASLVIFGSIACMAFNGNSCKPTPSADAFATIRPVTWCASRNGIFSVRTSKSAPANPLDRLRWHGLRPPQPSFVPRRAQGRA